ncbi:MAG: leucine-rich repeat domain-containing protein [Bacteroidales bacterium]|nr:leucine-rich repeat domain-containing protein [Clostridium sp.]MCM1203422.1 leucine-rich repeat domain-containing protein [Bacteroidales bacterium]
MRKKRLRLLSFALAATLVVSSANTGGVVFATGIDESEAVQQETISSEETTQNAEEISEEVTEAAVQTTEQVTETEVTTEEITTEAATEKETTEEAGESDTTAESTEEGLLEEEMETKAASNGVIADAVLLQMVVDAYNADKDTSKTSANFTLADLRGYDGELDFSSNSKASQVKSVAGLGNAKSATLIDMSSFTGVTEIAAQEFQGCGMTKVSLPANLQKIGEKAFESCTALTEIDAGTKKNTLPASLTEVGQQAFSNCRALKEITLPSFTAGGTILQSSASLFAGCSSLEKIVIGKGIQTIPVSAFSGAGISGEGVSLTFESGTQLDKILGSAFSGMKFTTDGTLNLTNCTKLASIADNAFEGAEGLETVILPSTLTKLELGSNTFAKTAVTSMYASGKTNTGIYLPDYVIGIGAGCFYGNTAMTAISLSPNLTAIPDYTFDGCTALASVTQRQSSGKSAVKEVGDCAFRGTAITNTDFLMKMNQLEVIGYQELAVTGIGKNNKDKVASPGLGGENTRVDDAKTHAKTYIENNRNKPCGSEVFTDCKELASVSIPASVKKIGSRAFYFANQQNQDGKELTTDITTDSVLETFTWASSTSKSTAVERRIYSEAFYGCLRLETVVLPQNANSGEEFYIDNYAFYNAKSLTTIGVTGSDNVFPVTLKAIGEGAFEFCASIPKVTIPSSEDGSCPELGQKVFQHCVSLASAALPQKITKIPEKFFYNCPIKQFSAGTAIEEFGNLSFMGHQFEILDLSGYTGLKEIGAGAFANADTIVENNIPDKMDKLMGGKTLQTCNGGLSVMTTVILPSKMKNDGTLYINSAAFCAHAFFTTMKTSNAGQNGAVYIPDYVKETGTAVFSVTPVSKVVYQADTTGKNQWKEIPEQMFEGCFNITEAKNVLPTGSYVQGIGKRAFAESSVTSADLSHYTSLKTIGTGSLPSSISKEPGAFEACESLTTVKLPTNTLISLEDKSFYGATALTSIDLGGTWLIATNGMANCTSLEKITFPDTMQKINKESFMGCTALQTVEFGKLEKIGEKAFYECSKLSLTKSGLPDSLTEIGNQAFTISKNNGSIGEVSFGPNLETIGTNAFQRSGVTKVDFSRAKKLKSIGNVAFSGNNTLKEFTISGTKVTEIGTDLLRECLALETVTLGDEIVYVNKNALACCPKFRSFTFASTTTISNEVFFAKGTAPEDTTAQQSSTPGKIAITVNTPKETLVPIGRNFYFPYYVNQKGKSNFDYILVGNTSSPATIDQHVKVTANLVDGYYKQRQSNEEGNRYKVTDTAYYEKVEPAPSMVVAASKQEIDTIQLAGLKPTDGTIDFSVVCSITFSCDEKTVSITADKFAANYKLKVENVPLMAELYEDKDKTTVIPQGQTKAVQAVDNKKGAFQCYYDIKDEELGSSPDTYDLVVETSNPDVIYAGSGSSVKKPEADENGRYTYTVSATKTDSKGTISGDTNKQTFYLIPAGIGTAVVTVYPKGYPQYPQKYTYTVNSDIKSIKLEVPKEYNNKISPGASFSVFSEYENYFGNTVSVKDMSKFKLYSNKTITFTSDAPEYVRVDQLGNVKVLKADATAKTVKITATAPGSVGGKEVKQTVNLKVKYQDTKVNENVIDQQTGATVAATKVSSKDLEGEAAFVKPKTTSATVTIPDTVTINGVKYKVTSVSANAFKNNTKIKTVKVGKYVKELGDNAFYGCKSLTKITLPKSLQRIGKKTFYNCKKLKTVSFAKNTALTEIGDCAFYNCVVLAKITVPAKVTKIGTKAFCNCKKLKTITIKSTVLNTVGKNAFKGIHKKAVIKVPKKMLSTYKTLLKGKGQKKTVKIKK